MPTANMPVNLKAKISFLKQPASKRASRTFILLYSSETVKEVTKKNIPFFKTTKQERDYEDER